MASEMLGPLPAFLGLAFLSFAPFSIWIHLFQKSNTNKMKQKRLVTSQLERARADMKPTAGCPAPEAEADGGAFMWVGRSPSQHKPRSKSARAWAVPSCSSLPSGTFTNLETHGHSGRGSKSAVSIGSGWAAVGQWAPDRGGSPPGHASGHTLMSALRASNGGARY